MIPGEQVKVVIDVCPHIEPNNHGGEHLDNIETQDLRLQHVSSVRQLRSSCHVAGGPQSDHQAEEEEAWEEGRVVQWHYRQRASWKEVLKVWVQLSAEVESNSLDQDGHSY